MIKNIYELICDACGTSYLYDNAESWPDLMQMMRDDGWRSRKKDETWEHYCVDCKY